MLFHLFTARPTLFVLTALGALLAIDTAIAQFISLYTGYLQGTAQEIIELEEDIALLLVAYGVLLEERALLISKANAGTVPEHEHELNEEAHSSGAYILMIGLFMELIDQLHGYFAEIAPFAATLGAATVIVLHICATLILLRFLWVGMRRPQQA